MRMLSSCQSNQEKNNYFFLFEKNLLGFKLLLNQLRKQCPKFDQEEYMVWFLCLMAYQLFVGYLRPKLFS